MHTGIEEASIRSASPAPLGHDRPKPSYGDPPVTSTLSILALASALAGPLDDAPAVELRYSGTIAPVSRNGVEAPSKRFSVYCLVVAAANGERELTYVVDEQGAGGWAWPERFGTLRLDRNGKPAGGAAIRVLYDHQGTENPLEIPQPLFEFADKLAEGGEWIDGKYSYEVTRRRELKDRHVWQIDGATNFGRRKRLYVAVDEPLLISAEQRLFMGRGDQFELRVDLESVDAVEASRLESLTEPAGTLVKLKSELGRKKNAIDPTLSAEQLAKAASYVERLSSEAEETPFARLAAVIARDVKTQMQRVDDVESLAKKHVGQPAPALALKALRGGDELGDDAAGKVVVLHFWKYHEDPLKEPYGQVGYLDFLDNQNRRRKLDVKVYGVAVDERFGKPGEARGAERQIRRFLEFMNVGYPIARDEGELLKKFGDPRSVGAQLPLWVVIGADGKIAHHKSGFYDINPDEGLKQLEAVIFEQARKARESGAE